jgi:hypothetical protein
MGKARILAALTLGVGAAGAGAATIAAFQSDMGPCALGSLRSGDGRE